MSVPSPPTIVVAPLASPNTLEFAWERPVSDGGSPITGYRFQLDSETAVSLDANTLYYRVTGLTNSQTYYATIEAQNANGFSSKASFRPFEPGSPPNPPATATVVISGTSNAVVSWTPPTVSPDSTIFWYVIKSVSNNSSDPVKNITANGLTQSNYLINNLNRNSRYSFDVQAVNCPGYSSATRTNTIAFLNSGEAVLATRSGGGTTQIFSTLATDPDGNVYQLIPVTNSSTMTIYNYSSEPSGGGEVGTTSYGSISVSTNDMVLIKYNSSGSVQWVTKLVNSGDKPAAINTDSLGNVYITYSILTGSSIFYNPVTTGGTITPSSYGTLTISTIGAICTLKYNTSGAIQWVTTTGSASELRFPSMTVDASGNVYVCIINYNQTGGTITTSLNNGAAVSGGTITPTLWGSFTTLAPGTAKAAAILVKYSTTGQVSMASVISNIDDINDLVCGLTTSSTGDIYVTVSSSALVIGAATIRAFTSNPASLNSLTSWGTISVNGGSGSARGAILVKYNSSGTPLWATKMEPAGGIVVVRYIPYLSVDSNGNLYWMAGIYGDNKIIFYNNTSGSGTGTTEYGKITPSGSYLGTPIILKFNSAGTIQWANYIYGATTGDFIPYKSMCDSAGNFFITAFGTTRMPLFNTAAPAGVNKDILPTFYGNIPPTGMNDIYIAKYNTSGNVVWGTSVAGTAGESYSALDITSSGSLWITGTYASAPVTINNFSNVPVTASNLTLSPFGTLADIGAGDNAFLVKFTA
jgi:hypothetical protein